MRLAGTAARNFQQRHRYRLFETPPKRYGNAVIVLDTHCNSTCGMCSSHSASTKPGTLTAVQWRSVVDKLHAHNPNIKISFVGGEPLLVEGLLPLLGHCRRKGIIFSMVTNGTLLDQGTARGVLETRPLALHVSLDSLKPEVYERIRGLDALTVVQENIACLRTVADEMASPVHLGIKATVTEDNVDEIADITAYADNLNMSVHYQPVLGDNKLARGMMDVDLDELDRQAARLVTGIETGASPHVTNSPGHIRTWRRYFLKQETERPFCPTSLENLFIMHDGSVRLCERYRRTVGNVYKQEISEIINSSGARELMAETYACKRNCSFIYKRSLRDYLRVLQVMRRATDT